MSEKDLIGAFQALRFVMMQLERKAGNILWYTNNHKQAAVLECIMDAAKEFLRTIEKCKPKDEKGDDRGNGGSGPKCDPDEHEEFGVCVPNN
jgi:hypothetical protein